MDLSVVRNTLPLRKDIRVDYKLPFSRPRKGGITHSVFSLTKQTLQREFYSLVK